MRLVIAVFAVLALSGCVEYYAAEIASLGVTDKTLGDHVVSLVSGKDCSLVRTEAGYSYCKEDEVEITPAGHCYRTLASVDCYREAHPQGGRYREIGLLDPNLPTAN